MMSQRSKLHSLTVFRGKEKEKCRVRSTCELALRSGRGKMDTEEKRESGEETKTRQTWLSGET